MAAPDREERIEKLVELFELLDQDNSGAIDVEEMRILGQVISADGSVPSLEEAEEQLKMADKDEDMLIDLGEWLEFSEAIIVLPRDKFDEIMTGYLAQVHKSLEPEGERYKLEKNNTGLPPLLCTRGSSKTLLIADEPPVIGDSTSPCKQFARARGLSVEINAAEAEDSTQQIPMVQRTPAGWFWGLCGNDDCSKPAKISCDRCNITLCSDHGTDHLLGHMQNASQGTEKGESPSKEDQQHVQLLSRVDSRFGFFPDALEDKIINSVATKERKSSAQLLDDLESEATAVVHPYDETEEYPAVIKSTLPPASPQAAIDDNHSTDVVLVSSSRGGGCRIM